jgi:hypothetical protein
VWVTSFLEELDVTIEDLFKQLLGPVGALVLVIVVLWAGWKGYWVWGWYAKELKTRIIELQNDNKELNKRLDRSTGVAEGISGLASRATRLAEKHQVADND